MNLIKFSKRVDYGTEYYVQVIFTKKWAVFQASLSWFEYPDWPFCQIKFGMGSLLEFLFSVYKFAFTFGFFEKTWRWDSNYLKNMQWNDDNETTTE